MVSPISCGVPIIRRIGGSDAVSAYELCNSSVVRRIICSLIWSRATISSYTSLLKRFEVGCPSTRPHASIVDSLVLELRRTMIPSSTDHFGLSRCGSRKSTSENSVFSSSLTSNSVLINRKNCFAIGRLWEKMPKVSLGSRRISWIVNPKVMISDFACSRAQMSQHPSGSA